jgi:hypothetical protein
MNSTLRNKINNYLISPFLKNIYTNQQLKEKLISDLNNILSNQSVDALLQAHETAQELALKMKSNTSEKEFFNNMDNQLLKFTSELQKKLPVEPTVEMKSEMPNNEEAPDKETPKSPKEISEISDIMKVLVNSVGKDSPDAMTAQGDLRELLKKYPNKVPEAVVEVITSKLRQNGLGIIFAVQTMSTLLALLIGLIPIPGVAVVADMIIGGTDAFIDGFVALGPESVTDFVNNGVNNAMKSIRKDLLPIFKETATIMANSMSGVFCCNKSQQNQANQNMDKYVDVLMKLITLISQGPSKNAEVESFINNLQNNVIKTKTVNTVDMNALDQLLNVSNESKVESSEQKTESTEPKTEGSEQKETVGGGWSKAYKKSINCKRPHGFSQKQFCKAKNKRTKKKRSRKRNKKRRKSTRKKK